MTGKQFKAIMDLLEQLLNKIEETKKVFRSGRANESQNSDDLSKKQPEIVNQFSSV